MQTDFCIFCTILIIIICFNCSCSLSCQLYIFFLNYTDLFLLIPRFGIYLQFSISPILQATTILQQHICVPFQVSTLIRASSLMISVYENCYHSKIRCGGIVLVAQQFQSSFRKALALLMNLDGISRSFRCWMLKMSVKNLLLERMLCVKWKTCYMKRHFITNWHDISLLENV